MEVKHQLIIRYSKEL